VRFRAQIELWPQVGLVAPIVTYPISRVGDKLETEAKRDYPTVPGNPRGRYSPAGSSPAV
jgi:hypothetical protein